VRNAVPAEHITQLVKAGRPLRADNPHYLRLRACDHRAMAPLAEQFRNRRIQLKLRIAPRLVHIVIKLTQRHGTHCSLATEEITVGDE
jgi:hypothetical protein